MWGGNQTSAGSKAGGSQDWLPHNRLQRL